MKSLQDQRRPFQRRHTVPQTRRPVIDRLGKMTFQRCHATVHDGLGRELTGASMLWSLAAMSSCPRKFKVKPSGRAPRQQKRSEK
jgi:hypothetical protein